MEVFICFHYSQQKIRMSRTPRHIGAFKCTKWYLPRRIYEIEYCTVSQKVNFFIDHPTKIWYFIYV